MIPDWMQSNDGYAAAPGGSTFAVKTIKSIGSAAGRLKFQEGKEKKHALPALLKFILLLLGIIVLSCSFNWLVILAFTAGLLGYLATRSPEAIAGGLKGSGAAALLTFILFLPAMLMHPEGRANNMVVVWKVFLSVQMVSLFNRSTQWNHITRALRRLHIPGIFIFTIDISLKYIVNLGRLISDLLTSYMLRAVGKNNKKYQSVGGIMGVTFLQGTEMSRKMYEAMQCRGFTDDYEGL